jgi:DNA-binding response OmpR family regulator
VPEGRILLVEDDESLRSVVARHLRARGWDVTEATSAEEAAAAIATGPRPSVVLLDINLPGGTGWDLLRGGAVGGAAGPPVVVVSATTIHPNRLREFGVAGYLPKPFALETLLEVCERFVARPASQPGASTAAIEQGENT